MADVNPEHPPAIGGGPPPPSISHSGSGGQGGHPSPGHPSPPYIAAHPAKHPYGPPPGIDRRYGGYYGGYHHAPAAHAPAESRYPPSTSGRHEEYARHPPPPVHYGGAHGYHHRTPSHAAAPAVIKPHPADRFGKTITVSNRTDIREPPTWGAGRSVPITIHSPRAAPTVHFSPSRGGAFQPYSKPEGNVGASSMMLQQPKIVEGGSSELETDEEVKAATEKGVENSDEEVSKEGSKEEGKEATAEEVRAGQDRAMKSVTHSSSMETAGSKEEAEAKEGSTEMKDVAAERAEYKEKLKPAPISTKRPRSANGEVNVDDDTPKHINIRHPAGSQPGSFHYPPKRTKVSDDGYAGYPPDASQTNHARYYSYEEDRQDRSQGRHPTTPGQPYRDGHPHDHPGQILSQAPSSHSLQLRDSWMQPGTPRTPTTEYPEPASYLPSHSMSWEVPPGTLSAIGSTLSFAGAGDLKASPSLRTSPLRKHEGDDVPPLPHGGSNLPPRKRALLAPRPSAPSSKLFEPPPPTATSGERKERTLEARSAIGGEPHSAPHHGPYAPTTVHDPRNRGHASYDRRDPHPDARYGGPERREAYDSPGRYGAEYESPGRYGVPSLPPPHDTSHHHHAPGVDGGGSFEGSFRSLDDLGLGSFSWEQGLPGGPSSTGYHRPASGGHPPPPSGHGAGYGGYGPPVPAHAGYYGGGHPPVLPTDNNRGPPNSGVVQLHEQQKIMKALAMRGEVRTIGDPNSPVGLLLLLAMPQDRHCLSETLCIVRNNIEIFTATDEDLNAPAPGRKRPIRLGQVGLRCVYCRMCDAKERVKRATCFPSSMKRIYRAVIDMKLDHFRHCPYVPSGLKARLDELKQGSTRSTGMTVQYFVKSAEEIGMTDVEDGVVIDLRRVNRPEMEHPHGPPTGRRPEMAPYSHPHYGGYPPAPPKRKGRRGQSQGYEPQGPADNSHRAPPALPPPHAAFQTPGAAVADPPHGVPSPPGPPPKRHSGRALLACPADPNFLSPLRCFLRENVCAFTATETDIAVRTPTTFSVRLGQVGVGCVHCLAASPKLRSNRAVCFPFTISRIYQSVADIQRFHLAECKVMPPRVRERFLRLQAESAKGSKGLATRTYWIDSARRIGLADGPGGMYFCRDPSLPPPPELGDPSDGGNLGMLALAASGEGSIGRVSLVAEEDRPTIAEFLYRVMEQLRPTRFSEADRNKRRSKDVGSIGVECRHCAGKIDGRKFFWSSVSAAESNFVSVHSHMLSCKYIPEPLKEELARLKALRREQTSRLKTGSQKAFFTRVWARLHGTPVPPIMTDLPTSGKGKAKRAGKGGKQSSKKKAVKAVPDTSVPDIKRNDSAEVRAILESQSTLSSMPSLDSQELAGMDGELKTQSDDVAGKKIVSQGSKGSLSTVRKHLEKANIAEV